MLKLYGAPFSRAAIVQWYLEEFEIAYEYQNLRIDKKTKMCVI